MEVPQYQLAICEGYNEAWPKYYNYGTLVPNILSNGEYLMNIFEYFTENPSNDVNIEKYINYCMMFYDYTNILNSKIFDDNYNLGSNLAFHILLSILKGDQNYHYENVAFVCNNGGINRFAQMIDHEFSTMFLYPDHISTNAYYLQDLILKIHTENNVINNNITCICNKYSEIIKLFLEKLERFIDYMKGNIYFSKTSCFTELKNSGFLFDCNSNSYKIGIERYKNNDESKAKIFEQCILPINISENAEIIFDEIIIKGIILVAEELKKELKKKMKN